MQHESCCLSQHHMRNSINIRVQSSRVNFNQPANLPSQRIQVIRTLTMVSPRTFKNGRSVWKRLSFNCTHRSCQCHVRFVLSVLFHVQRDETSSGLISLFVHHRQLQQLQDYRGVHMALCPGWYVNTPFRLTAWTTCSCNKSPLRAIPSLDHLSVVYFICIQDSQSHSRVCLQELNLQFVQQHFTSRSPLESKMIHSVYVLFSTWMFCCKNCMHTCVICIWLTLGSRAI